MKVSLVYADFLLLHRGGLMDFSDANKVTGSELGLMRLAQEWVRAGHEVVIYCNSNQGTFAVDDRLVPVMPTAALDAKVHKQILWGERVTYDVLVSLNDPRPLQHALPGEKRVCVHWINSFEFAGHRFWEHVDRWVAASAHHRQYLVEREHVVYKREGYDESYFPNPEQWGGVELGCDPQQFDLSLPKVPGKVVYCSSPDRGLHWLLQQWPRIKRAVPHATLHIFYGLRQWLDSWDAVQFHPPIEPLRARAVYIEEVLRRLAEHYGSVEAAGIHVVGGVPHDRMILELCSAEVMAYPCDPVNAYTEGFSCSTVEACAARACPVVSDADALGSIYGGHAAVVPRGEWQAFGDTVIRALTDAAFRDETNSRARALAEEMTWTKTAKRLLEEMAK